jgi:uncharacterized membrane protein SpoIIM required for sporulation
VDIDRYIARNEPTWLRLDDLSKRAHRSVGGMSPAEIDELVQLYQRTSSHLSFVRTNFREPTLTARLTRLVASANGVIYGKRAKTWKAVARFFALTYPAAVYHYRRSIRVAALLFFVPAFLLGVWLTNDRAALDASAPRKVRQAYVHDEFEPYYSDQPSALFFVEVTTNNIRVSFLTYALGAVSGGLGALYLLVLNGAPLGIISAWMISEGDFWRFLGFILPHGALELSAIIIAGGAGLGVGWTIVAPGDRTRSDAFREEGLRSITIVLGLMTMFLAAGLMEGFITGSGLPVGVRVGLGVLLWVSYVAYLTVQGRTATALGITGLLVDPPRKWADEPDRTLPADALLDVPGRLA